MESQNERGKYCALCPHRFLTLTSRSETPRLFSAYACVCQALQLVEGLKDVSGRILCLMRLAAAYARLKDVEKEASLLRRVVVEDSADPEDVQQQVSAIMSLPFSVSVCLSPSLSLFPSLSPLFMEGGYLKFMRLILAIPPHLVVSSSPLF